MLFRELFEIETRRGISCTNITANVQNILDSCRIKEGLCNVYVLGSKAGITVSENNMMLNQDFKKLFEMIDEKAFFHHPNDACSHLRAQLTDNEKTIPVSKGRLLLEKNQGLVLWEFDAKECERKIIVTVSGE
ncbi:MAG: YjbQ family protein [Candidatus Aenigmarchaeota archaeon]|nr:YjbQ family protein [Candidatus Aenigmarchaeota archaeon]